MINFKYIRASTPETAVKSVVKDNSSQFLAGGTNLVDLMKKGVTTPDTLIDINGLALKEIRKEKNAIHIGALALNSDVADNPVIRKEQPLLSQALSAGASQQIRNMATVGGNMMQRTRCSYFYNPDMPCNKREPGTGCGALKGFNRMHAIFGTSDKCIAVHPSDMCIALTALDAVVVITGPKGERRIPFEKFHRLPGDAPQKDNNLERGELIVAVEVPDNRFREHSHYMKIRDRSSYAFALVSVAAAADMQGSTINDIRLAMGGVAHMPWRLKETEVFLQGKQASDATFKEAATIAMKGATGYGHNNFKLTLAPNTIIETLKAVTGK